MFRKSLPSFATLLLISLAEELHAYTEWAGRTVDHLHNEFYTIFESGNRNAASHKWSTFILDRSQNLSPTQFEALWQGFCAISGSPIFSDESRRYGMSLERVPTKYECDAAKDTGELMEKTFIFGFQYHCCWPCVCDALDLLKVDTKTVKLREWPGYNAPSDTEIVEKEYYFNVIPNPCADQGAKLSMSEFEYVDGTMTTLAKSAPELSCNGSMLEGATYSDNGYVIIGLFHNAQPATSENLDLGCTEYNSDMPGRYSKAEAPLMETDPASYEEKTVRKEFKYQSECEYITQCEDRKKNKFQSGMGQIFREAAMTEKFPKCDGKEGNTGHQDGIPDSEIFEANNIGPDGTFIEESPVDYFLPGLPLLKESEREKAEEEKSKNETLAELAGIDLKSSNTTAKPSTTSTSTTTALDLDCKGSFSDFGPCRLLQQSANLYSSTASKVEGNKRRVYSIMTPKKDGGADCPHKDGYVEIKPCTLELWSESDTYVTKTMSMNQSLGQTAKVRKIAFSSAFKMTVPEQMKTDELKKSRLFTDSFCAGVLESFSTVSATEMKVNMVNCEVIRVGLMRTRRALLSKDATVKEILESVRNSVKENHGLVNEDSSLLFNGYLNAIAEKRELHHPSDEASSKTLIVDLELNTDQEKIGERISEEMNNFVSNAGVKNEKITQLFGGKVTTNVNKQFEEMAKRVDLGNISPEMTKGSDLCSECLRSMKIEKPVVDLFLLKKNEVVEVDYAAQIAKSMQSSKNAISPGNSNKQTNGLVIKNSSTKKTDSGSDTSLNRSTTRGMTLSDILITIGIYFACLLVAMFLGFLFANHYKKSKMFQAKFEGKISAENSLTYEKTLIAMREAREADQAKERRWRDGTLKQILDAENENNRNKRMGKNRRGSGSVNRSSQQNNNDENYSENSKRNSNRGRSQSNDSDESADGCVFTATN